MKLAFVNRSITLECKEVHRVQIPCTYLGCNEVYVGKEDDDPIEAIKQAIIALEYGWEIGETDVTEECGLCPEHAKSRGTIK